MNIIERSSGYWLVDDSGAVDGPFNTPKEAEDRRKELEIPEPDHDHPNSECKHLGFGIWDCGVTDQH